MIMISFDNWQALKLLDLIMVNYLIVGTDSAVNSSSAKVQIAHTNANARIDISRFSDDNAPPYFEIFKTRSVNTIGGNGRLVSKMVMS